MKRDRAVLRMFGKAGEPRMDNGKVRTGQEARAMAQITPKTIW